MRYLIDANIFIQSANDFYRFSVVPGFWDWLLNKHHDGLAFTLSEIRGEIDRGIMEGDPVQEWFKTLPSTFFLPPDERVGPSNTTLTKWINENSHYTQRAKDAFSGSVDYKLIAYALAFGDTVVTFEASEPNRKNKVKIPDACKALNVPWVRIWDMLSTTNACFTFQPQQMKTAPLILPYGEEGSNIAPA